MKDQSKNDSSIASGSDARWISLLRTLVQSDGVSGCEEKVRDVIDQELSRVCGHTEVDGLGNIFASATRTPKPEIMLAAHMDEVGFFVKHVRADGYLSFELNGGVNPNILPSQWVRISTANGSIVRGIVGTKSAHFAKDESAKVDHKSLVIDIGTRTPDEVAEAGVRVGDFATFDRDLLVSQNGGFLIGKALDNRIGCTVMVEAMKRISQAEAKLSEGVCAVGTVREEIGGAGARVAAHKLDPKVAIVLDGLPASDIYIPPEQSSVEVGGGPAIRKAEVQIPNSSVTPKWLFELAVEAAEEAKIPHQLDVASAFFSDAYAISESGSGVPTLPLLVPRRNSHSPAEIASIADVENTIILTVEVIRRLHSKERA